MMYGIILIISFNICSFVAISVRHLGFLKLYFDRGICEVHTLCTILDPKQVTTCQNESLRMIIGQIIGILRIWRPSWTQPCKLNFLHVQILVNF